MIPWLIAGAVGALVASEVMDDNKKELQTSKSREQVSASDVPADIRAQIEGRTKNFKSKSSLSNNEKKAKNWYRYANEYYYGLNGESVDYSIAKTFFQMAADAGHFEAKKKLRELF